MFVKSFFIFVLTGIIAFASVNARDDTSNDGIDVMDDVRNIASQMTSQMTMMSTRLHALEGLVQQQQHVIARHEATIQAQQHELQVLQLRGARDEQQSSVHSVQSRNVINKYAFSAYLSRDIPSMSGNQTVIFDTALLNEGDAYNPNTGVFTVQVGGVYLFSFVINTYKNLPTVVKLVVNGNVMSHDAIWPHYDPSANMQGSNVVLLRLQRGDRVWVANSAATYGAELHGGDNVRATTFSGVFLYE